MWKGHLLDALNWKLLEAIRVGDWGYRVLFSEGILGFESICLGWFGGGPGDKVIETRLGLSFTVLNWGPGHPQTHLSSLLSVVSHGRLLPTPTPDAHRPGLESDKYLLRPLGFCPFLPP